MRFSGTVVRGLALVLTITLLAEVRAQDASDLQGRQVILKSPEATLMIGEKVVGRGDVFRVYRVDRVNGDWVWLVHTSLSGWAQVGDVLPFDGAIDYFTKLISADPTNPSLYQIRASCQIERGDHDAALLDLNEAIRLDPQGWGAYATRGFVRERKRQFPMAINDYTEALRIAPEGSGAYIYFIRGNVYRKLKQYDAALKDYAAAIAQDPRLADAYVNQAWVLATSTDPNVRDGARAVELATQACELVGWRSAAHLDALAAAYAEVGKFEDAVKWQNEAINNLPPDDAEARSRFQMHLKRYQEKQPLRDEQPDQFKQ